MIHFYGYEIFKIVGRTFINAKYFILAIQFPVYFHKHVKFYYIFVNMYRQHVFTIWNVYECICYFSWNTKYIFHKYVIYFPLNEILVAQHIFYKRGMFIFRKYNKVATNNFICRNIFYFYIRGKVILRRTINCIFDLIIHFSGIIQMINIKFSSTQYFSEIRKYNTISSQIWYIFLCVTRYKYNEFYYFRRVVRFIKHRVFIWYIFPQV